MERLGPIAARVVRDAVKRHERVEELMNNHGSILPVSEEFFTKEPEPKKPNEHGKAA